MSFRIFCTVIFLFFCSASFEQTPEESTPPPPPFDYHRDFKNILDQTLDRNSDWYYHKLIIRFLNDDTSLTKMDVLALMIGFTENPHYKPLEDMETEQEIFELNKQAEFVEVIHKSKPFLQTHPLNLLVLREISFAYNRMSMNFSKKSVIDSSILYKDSSDYFMNLNDKIMEAMIYSGKGKKAETAIFSLGLADGEYFIPNVGFTIDKKDTQWAKNGDFMEVIESVTAEGVKINFYFVIQHAKLKIDDDMANQLPAKKAKKNVKKKEKVKKTNPAVPVNVEETPKQP